MNPETRQIPATIVRVGLTRLVVDITVPSHILAFNHEVKGLGSVGGDVKISFAAEPPTRTVSGMQYILIAR